MGAFQKGDIVNKTAETRSLGCWHWEGRGRDGHVLVWIGEQLLGPRGDEWQEVARGWGLSDPTVNFLSCSAHGGAGHSAGT